jgi:hypothetical protein
MREAALRRKPMSNETRLKISEADRARALRNRRAAGVGAGGVRTSLQFRVNGFGIEYWRR